MALDESETLPLLQQDTEPRSGRRATRRVLAAAAALVAAVALSALAYSSTVPRAARRGAFSWTTHWPPPQDYHKTCKDCSSTSLSWSCNCRDLNGAYIGMSTVWKWTCEGTELENVNGCLQCKYRRISAINMCMANPGESNLGDDS